MNNSSNALNIKQIVADLVALPVDQIDEDVPLFALGIDSITIIELELSIEDAGFEFSLDDMFSSSTIKDIEMRLLNKTGA